MRPDLKRRHAHAEHTPQRQASSFARTGRDPLRYHDSPAYKEINSLTWVVVEPFAYLDQMLLEGIARTGRLDEALDATMALRRELVDRGEFFGSEELSALVGAMRFAQTNEIDDARGPCQTGLDEAAARGAHGLRLRIALRFAGLLEEAGKLAEAETVLEDAIARHPDSEGSRRYWEAVDQRARVQLTNQNRNGTDQETKSTAI